MPSTIRKIQNELKEGALTVRSLVDSYLVAAKEKNGEINAYLEIFDDIDRQIERAEKMIDEGAATELAGIPIAVKDNILIKGRKAGAASKMLEDYTAPYDAHVIAKLRAAGAVFIGRTNMDEFAMGGSTENSAYGPTKNPVDPERVSGGSSGGSAAAVAMGGALAALGSDTGGSVRQPASFCGVVGLKPTYGAVSRSGLIAMGSSLDQIGPLTKTVADAELIFGAIRGKDALDSTSLPADFYARDEKTEVKTIGVPRAMIEKLGAAKETAENFEQACKSLEGAGYTIKDVELPNAAHALSAYYILMPAEVSSNLARFDGVKYGRLEEGEDLLEQYLNTRGEGLGAEVRRRIMLGTYILSSGYYDAYYRRAEAARSLIAADLERAFGSGVDAIATPTTPGPAFMVGEKSSDPMQMYLQDVFTVPANIAGIPALSVPSGTVDAGGAKLPLGLQLMAPHGGEGKLFAIGKKFEAAQ